MTAWIRQALANGLYGKLAHCDVLKALKGLTAATAKKSPIKNEHSIWDHLFHMVFWHDITMKTIQRQDINWDAIKGTDWLKKDAQLDDKAWNDILATFTQHLIDLKKIAETQDLRQPIEGFDGMPLGKAILVELQHNSYHIGQIVTLRKLQGLWPPPEE